MPPPIFLDTLFVVRLVNRLYQYHRQSVALSERFEGYPCLPTNVVLQKVKTVNINCLRKIAEIRDKMIAVIQKE